MASLFDSAVARNTGVAGWADVVAGAKFKGDARVIDCTEETNLTEIIGAGFAVTGTDPAVIDVATETTLGIGTHYLDLLQFVADAPVRVYLGKPLTVTP